MQAPCSRTCTAGSSLPPLLRLPANGRPPCRCRDMPLAASPAAVDAAFGQLLLEMPGLASQPQQPQHRAALERFCSRWLLPTGSDLLPAEVPQLAAGPPPGWLPGVARPDVRRWAEHLFHTWGALCRQVCAPSLTAALQRALPSRTLRRLCSSGHDVPQYSSGPLATCLVCSPAITRSVCPVRMRQVLGPFVLQAAPEVAAHPDRHSLLPPPGAEGQRAFVVPGSRFREMYYWQGGWGVAEDRRWAQQWQQASALRARCDAQHPVPPPHPTPTHPTPPALQGHVLVAAGAAGVRAA